MPISIVCVPIPECPITSHEIHDLIMGPQSCLSRYLSTHRIDMGDLDSSGLISHRMKSYQDKEIQVLPCLEYK